MSSLQYCRQTLRALLASIGSLQGFTKYSGPSDEHARVLWTLLNCRIFFMALFGLYHSLSAVLEYSVASARHHLNSKSLLEYLSGLPSVPVWRTHPSPYFGLWHLEAPGTCGMSLVTGVRHLWLSSVSNSRCHLPAAGAENDLKLPYRWLGILDSVQKELVAKGRD
jgi:hypothetical protein